MGSGVTNMMSMFSGATTFNNDLSGWNVSGVTCMRSMFYWATAFNNNLSAWNVSGVTTMSYMFNGATAFNQDLCAWGDTFNYPYVDGRPVYPEHDGVFSGSGCSWPHT